MRSLRTVAVGILIVLVAPPLSSARARAAAEAPDLVDDYVAEAARRFAIPEGWIHAVMRVESAGNPRAVSPRGACGLMQIMPATWSQLRIRYRLGDDIYDPHDNILAGAAYLREMHDRYGTAGFLAAYNAGPGRYDAYLTTGRALPLETVAYARRLAPLVGGRADSAPAESVPDPLAWTRGALFTARTTAPSDGAGSASDFPPDRRSFRPSVAPPAVAPSLFIARSVVVGR
ncbi:lytic transglycosylase domain-containing protein [Sphingomonas glacialis]|uniref:Lytic transglycosylase domain-containing protein n=1 Tax=Sphingomonas glacialis TaxID=658225 RepID=A0A502FF65_9SPHN|nr:lytic transglycosylase domain-containing protein [Sphingomonas glacialis]TPG48065.1 lytic transglycosylase domain-containing protein [Sphingomonas glacialis]